VRIIQQTANYNHTMYCSISKLVS